MHNRKSIRLKNWDYGSEGAYFITLLVKNRNHLFGEIKNDKVNLSIFGEIAENEYKGTVTKKINELRNTPFDSVWQRNYFDRIIRNENEYNRVCEYIYYNPLKWEIVNNNPENYKLK